MCLFDWTLHQLYLNSFSKSATSHNTWLRRAVTGCSAFLTLIPDTSVLTGRAPGKFCRGRSPTMHKGCKREAPGIFANDFTERVCPPNRTKAFSLQFSRAQAFELKKSLRRVFAEDITENVFVFGLLVAFFILSLPSETPWVARETKQTIFGKVWGTMTHRAQVSACV